MFRSLLITALLALSSQAIAATATNIANSAEQVSPLLPGLTIQNVDLKDQFGKSVSLGERFKEKTTVLIVYRGGWCPYCSRQLVSVQKIEKQLASLNAQIIAISPDSPEKLAESKISSPNYQLLSERFRDK